MNDRLRVWLLRLIAGASLIETIWRLFGAVVDNVAGQMCGTAIAWLGGADNGATMSIGCTAALHNNSLAALMFGIVAVITTWSAVEVNWVMHHPRSSQRAWFWQRSRWSRTAED